MSNIFFSTNNYNFSNKSAKYDYYSQDQYLNAISWIQSNTYTSIQKAWGVRWRQNLCNALPFILKLLRFGYNDFLVQRISSNRSTWIYYDENTALDFLRSNGIASEVYSYGVAYPKMGIRRNNKSYIKEWHILKPFEIRPSEQADAKAILHIIDLLIKVGAMAKVADSLILDSGEKYSNSYIISKERCRELVSLFLSTFSSTLTHSTLSISISTYNTQYIPLSPLGDTKGGPLDKLSKNYPLLEYNNSLLPEDEMLSFSGRRAYSNVCSFLNEEKHEYIKPGIMTIQKYCNKIFGEDNWFEFDRRGSIYNMTRSLNKKDYLSNSTDIYELMNGKPFASKEERKYFKLTQMNVYFSNLRRLSAMLSRSYEQVVTLHKPIKTDTYELLEAYWHLVGEPEDWNDYVMAVRENFKKRQKIMKKIIGDNKPYIDAKGRRTPKEEKNPDLIFVHESLAYLQFVTKLRQKGIRVVQVFDGFALPKNCGLSEAELDKILEETIMEYVK